MSRHEDYEMKSEKLITPIIEENKFELVDVEFVKELNNWYLRAYIDKPGGITVDDCEIVSRAFEAKLDEADFIEEAYILEVSSPGLMRPLKKDKDYARSIGKLIDVKLFKAVDKQKEFSGYLKEYTKDTVTFTVNNEDMTVNRADLALIRLAYVE